MRIFSKTDKILLTALGGIIAATGAAFAIYKSDKLKHSLFRSKKSRDFALSLIILVATIIKAEGKPLKRELNYVKDFFLKNFGKEATGDALLILKDLLKEPIEIKNVCEKINKNIVYTERLQLLHFLFSLSVSDNYIKLNEFVVLELIAKELDLTDKDYLSIKSTFYSDLESAYKILEIEQDATETEVKQAYRKMALKYHPDKMEYLGEEIYKAANIKFQKVNNAYEKIKSNFI